MQRSVRKVVIVGGGTAGWMTAAALAKLLIPAGVSVTLIESDLIGSIGVGEATIPTIRDFNDLLEIDEDEFVRQTQGTFKLGIQFEDWTRLGDRYIHPFGKFGRDLKAVRFQHLWLKLLHDGNVDGDLQLKDFSAATLAALSGRFGRGDWGPQHPLSTLGYAFHFDAERYARFLRNYAERAGVRRVEGKVVYAEQDSLSGDVLSVRLPDESRIEGDLFVDCSGFRSLLLGGLLSIPFEDWSRWLPCDRAVALPSSAISLSQPYTKSMAEDAGWRWNIPLQNRTGNGYVYSGAWLSDAHASDRVAATIEGGPLSDPRLIKFIAGHRRQFWSHNVVGIGLAGGFLEPLESTSIHLIQTAISRLLLLFPNPYIDEWSIREFNRQSVLEYEQVRDFIILHYKATERNDSDFWNYCREMTVPDSLLSKIELFRSSGKVFRVDDELFSEDSWLAVMFNQGISPSSHDRVADAILPKTLHGQMKGLSGALRKAVEALPQHAAEIGRLRQGRD